MKDAKILVAGYLGMVGQSIYRELKKQGFSNVHGGSREEVDFTNQQEVFNYLTKSRFDQIYIAAAKVGGIHANNTFPADFIYQNLMIEANLIHGGYLAGTEKILFLGSSCIYPREVGQPMQESSLLSGHLEQTNEPYAIAKIAGIKLCESYNRQYKDCDYRSVMPANLYGPGDNYHLENSHVIPALIRKFHEAKVNNDKDVKVWGTGLSKREFLYVDDLARACVLIMNLEVQNYHELVKPMRSHINVGFGDDLTIKDLAYKIASTVGFEGAIEFDLSRPDGPKQKLLDVTLLKQIGWLPTIGISKGLKLAYEDFLASENLRK